jgi:murein DD-endopeptidase MepM/ murein hydrolase activator NlpD
MKSLQALALGLATAWQTVAADLSSGVYRIPYANGISVNVLQDHLTHVPATRIDLFGTNSSGVGVVVAAAAGTIRFIVDTNSGSCASCASSNNYVWIEHSNGEWTKYSHLQTGSVRGRPPGGAGLSTGDVVTAGTFLGNQGAVGATTVTNLHFEVGVPDDPSDPIFMSGGFIKGVNRIPIICGISNNIFVQNQSYVARDCNAPEFSYGVYRIGYQTGTQVSVGGDHLTHNPATRIDMSGFGGRGPYRVAAAADGIIRAIVDTNYLTCTSCAVSNNYVWIEHPNGEWTKYSHMQTGTTTAPPPNGAGLSVGDPVCAGDYLGDEDDVGRAQGKHLHWEVAVPDDLSDPFDPAGGFIKGKNRIPIVCDIAGNIFVDSQTYTADPCSSTDCARSISLPAKTVYGAEVHMASADVDSNNNAYTVYTYAAWLCGPVPGLHCALGSAPCGSRISTRPFRTAMKCPGCPDAPSSCLGPVPLGKCRWDAKRPIDANSIVYENYRILASDARHDRNWLGAVSNRLVANR